jgi:type IV pilus assembly protein PilM
MQHLKPFTDASVEVDLIQIAPLSLYNYLSFDQFGIRIGDDTVGLDEYTIVLDMGADNTTLLVSNGQKIWIRNVPIGGNHFTRALTKEMKLTFAKAEHLKCNATRSPDPRSVFQALRTITSRKSSDRSAISPASIATRKSPVCWGWATASSSPGCRSSCSRTCSTKSTASRLSAP